MRYSRLRISVNGLVFVILQAYESLSDGLGKTATALIRSPLKTYQRGGGVGSAFVTAVRGAPAAAIAPASAAAQALHCAFLGFRNRSISNFVFCTFPALTDFVMMYIY